MPRSKNPKPQQLCAKSEVDDELSPCSVASREAESEMSGEPALSPPSLSDVARTEADDSAGPDGAGAGGETVEGRSHDPENMVVALYQPRDSAEQQTNLPENTGKTRKGSLGMLNPNILAWLRKRFTLREDAKTSASQVIKLYEKEFQGYSDAPLQSYQVGQLLRRIFPNIQRCKITVKGKRIWVYKHLGRTRDDEDWDYKDDSSYSLRQDNRFNDAGSNNEEISKRSLVMPVSERKHVKNSAILYNLLYPHRGNVGNDKLRGSSNDASTDKPADKPALKSESHGIETNKKSSQQDGNIIQWLRDNYEYADGFFVKSLDVLKRYNQGRQTMIKYLSQVGRVIKYVFPKARHLRRSLKGGKREWVYHNIRPKEHSDNDIWRGSTKNLDKDSAFRHFDSRPTLVAFSRFGLDKALERDDDADVTSNATFRNESRNAPSRISLKTDSDSARSDEGSLFEFSTSRVNHFRDGGNVFGGSGSPQSTATAWWLTPEARSDDGGEVNDVTGTTKVTSEKKTGDRRSYLELQIDRLKTEKSNSSPESGEHGRNVPIKREPEISPKSSENEAEDLSISSQKRPQKRSFCDETGNETGPVPTKRAVPDRGASPEILPPGGESALQTDHNYSFAQIVDSDLRVRNFTRTDSASLQRKNNIGQQGGARQDSDDKESSRNAAKAAEEFIQWEDLSMCGAHRFGWSLTPTRSNAIPCNYIEWILFDGQALKDGQRVLRELKIYDDWSVSIHCMGRKVYPDELGGIIDLMRTKQSVMKVFATISSARCCRGLPAVSLSDLCVHGVVVAKSEIWSSREEECEELRHRAINCQVLYQGNDECCQKCNRVIRMHTQNLASSTGNNGFTEKGTTSFVTRPTS